MRHSAKDGVESYAAIGDFLLVGNGVEMSEQEQQDLT